MTTLDQQPQSLWQLKPWWCQPWSILLTGVLLPTLAWLGFHRLWVVLPIGVGVFLWWIVFLYLVPKQFAEAIKASGDQLPMVRSDP